MDARLLDYDGTFFRGVKSDSDPSEVPLGYAWMTMNMLNVGGALSCRPGYRCIVTFPQGKLQGATLFRPAVGLEQIVCCIDGILYAATYPFRQFRLLPNVRMSTTAKQLFWAQTVQSARRTSTDFSATIEVIPPRNVLFFQDGAKTAPGWYDGSDSGHVRDNEFETPAGGPMAWTGDRLWVARGSNVYASDIANPFSFREQVFQGSVQSFPFSREVTALAVTPSLEFPQLIVYTQSNASIIQANIRNRVSWQTTDNMQVEVFQVGCSSQRSLVSHFGRLSWFSESGFVFFDAATVGKLTARIPIRDNEMMVSKSRLNEDLSLVAGAAFGQYIMMSVPHEDVFNKHTWVLNNASLETLSDDSGPSWSGYWMGTRPVEWVYGVIAGSERVYHVSTDEDGENRLWEAFTPDRLDNGCPITWAFYSRGYFGATAQQKKLPGSDCKFMWADVALCGIAEDLDIGVFYAGGLRGSFKQILGKKISVAQGSLSFNQNIVATSQLFAYKPQSRVVRTEDANQQSTSLDSGTCHVESEKNENLDLSIQLLVVGHGPATIHWVRAVAQENPEDTSGSGEACVDEKAFNAVRFDGAGGHAEDQVEAMEVLASRAIQHFTSNRTEVVTYQNISEVGVGFAESIVSQRAADRVASIIATKQAENEIGKQLPPILSIGDEST
jgi:hypothetical protein